MIEPDELAAYFEGELDPAARAQIEAEFAANPDSLQQAVDQRRMDQALSVLLCASVRLVDGGDLAAQRCLKVDLQSDGIPPFHRGSAISGISYLAGMLRQSELDRGIAHALSCCVPQTALTRTGPEDPAYVWPAMLQPNIGQWGQPWLDSLAKTGNLRLGALLAIPGSVDIAKIGLGNSGPGFELARALQDYGVYVTGTFEDGGAGPEITHRLIITAEPGLTDKLPADVNASLTLVARYLKIVINNGPQSLGGGGLPRRSLAPEFSP